MGIKLATKTLIIYQSQELLISLGQSEVFRLYYFLSRYLNKRKINQSRI